MGFFVKVVVLCMVFGTRTTRYVLVYCHSLSHGMNIRAVHFKHNRADYDLHRGF